MKNWLGRYRPPGVSQNDRTEPDGRKPQQQFYKKTPERGGKIGAVEERTERTFERCGREGGAAWHRRGPEGGRAPKALRPNPEKSGSQEGWDPEGWRHAIVDHDSVQANCIEKAVCQGGDKTFFQRLSTLRPAPKIILKDVAAATAAAGHIEKLRDSDSKKEHRETCRGRRESIES